MSDMTRPYHGDARLDAELLAARGLINLGDPVGLHDFSLVDGSEVTITTAEGSERRIARRERDGSFTLIAPVNLARDVAAMKRRMEIEDHVADAAGGTWVGNRAQRRAARRAQRRMS